MIQDVKKIYLCDLNLKPITQLNGVQTDTVSLSKLAKDIGELTFEVDEYVTINGEQIKSNGYDDLDLYMTLCLEDTGMYQMQKPAESGDSQKHTKSVVAYSLEKEFEDKNWINFKVNTGAKDSLEQLATGNLNDMGFAKEFVSFYNPDNKELSFIDLVLEYMPAWSYDPKDIDILLVKKKMPSMEEKNISLYNLMTSRVAPRMECLFLFDTIHRKIKVVAKSSLNDKKYESTVFIGYRNLAKQIDVSVNEDTVFTRFNCYGDNDLNILNVNYQDNYIYNLDYFTRYPYMSDELISKVKKWTEFRETHREEYISLSRQSKINMTALNDAISKAHEHANKAKLDTYDKTQTELLAAAAADAQSKVAVLKKTVDGKADKATTLAGYGIEDAYNKTEIEIKLKTITDNVNTKVDATTVDSKISTAKSEITTAYEESIDTKLNAKVGDLGESATVVEFVNKAVGSGGADIAGQIDNALREAKKYTDDALTIVEF